MHTGPGKTKLISLISMLLFWSLLGAQPETADSIKQVLGFSNDASRISLLLKLSEAYMKYSPKKAIDPAVEARILSVQNSNDTLEARSLMIMGQAHYKCGNFKEAIDCFKLSSALYAQMSMPKEQGQVFIQMANTYRDLGSYDDGLKSALEAYRLFEKQNDKRGMSSALIVSGNVYRAMENYNKSILDYEKAMKMSREIGDMSNEASCLNNISNVYSDKEEYDKAIDYLQRARVLYEKLDDKFSLARVLNNIGVVYLDTKRYDEATDYFLRTLEIHKQQGDKRGQAMALANLGMVSQGQENPDKAIEYLGRSLELAKTVGSTDIMMAVYESLSEAYESKGEYDKSLEFYRNMALLKDSIFSENLSESIAEMQAQYDVEKAESEARAQEKEKKLITFSAVGGGVLLVVIVVILWNRAVARKRVNIRLNQQKQEIVEKNAKLHEANVEIELKNKDITDSIQYASRIQEAILPEVEFAATFGDTGFVLFRPKDIVSGDFYWTAQVGDYLLFAAVDCTGHGVPGAFMSIVCSNLLSQSVKEHGLIRPDEILNDVNIRLSETLRQRRDESRVRDGMDIALCCINKKTLHMTFAGAYNPAWIFRGTELIELTPDKFPVGLFEEEELRIFKFREIQLQKGDRIYVFSDGYSDQFGGPLGKKYKRSTFVEFVRGLQTLPVKEQRELLEQEHLAWKGTNEQIDDILVMGVEV